MAERITINPFTRISGFMEIEADIENNRIVSAKTKGLMYRGFEKMLVGRSPFDAVYFTERICGICSTAHAVTSSLALENALGIVPSEQGRYLRDILHGCEYLQNHIRHFYQFTIPDYVKFPTEYPMFQSENTDYRLLKTSNDRMVKNYLDSLQFSRSAHQMLAILGGKAPHNHGVFIGGVTTQATADRIIEMKSIVSNIIQFINENMLPDVYEIGLYYPEYFQIGSCYANLLSYGCFDRYKELGTLYVDPLVYENGTVTAFNPDNISEQLDYSWYSVVNDTDKKNLEFNVDNHKAQGYTWVKAARYNNTPFEVGPLARQWLCGEYTRGSSAMDRTIARVLEAKKIASILSILLQNLIPGTVDQQTYTVPQTTSGQGFVDTARGALAHWINIKDSKIDTYQIITPSVWNLSSQTDNMPGPAEQSLIGTYINDMDNPIEIGRIIRSFDPCVSCATHVFSGGKFVHSIQTII